MCLIIQRQPNFEIPYEKFKSAVEVNPDGYGLAVPDNNGKLITLRSPDTPDVDKLYRMINEELLDKELLIHLRYNTVGDTTLRNAHPFPVLEKKTDGIDLRMAHNGTLFDYKKRASEGESDTRAFVREFVRPLFKRMARGIDPAELLDDPFIQELLEDKLSTQSVLTFMDGNGNTMLCNATGNGGKVEDGWYYSNSYSFNANHRKPQATGGKKTYPAVAYSGPKTSYSTGGTTKQATSFVCRGFETPRFTDKHGIGTDVLTQLSDDSIMAACTVGEASLLIKELIYELDKARGMVNTLNRKLKAKG